VDYWRLGVIFGVIFFPGFLPIGVRWMLALRVMASNQSRMGHDFLGGLPASWFHPWIDLSCTIYGELGTLGVLGRLSGKHSRIMQRNKEGEF
jgi:hypothetical protein